MAALVIREDQNGLASLILNRPEKMNALTVQMFLELDEHVIRIEQETDRIGVVVIRGAGKCFSAGNDLDDIAAGQPPPHMQAKVIERLANLPQPVIAAVHGHCYTGALELALAGDLMIAAESARFSDTHAKWALVPGWGLSQRLPRRVGLPKAREMMFIGRSYSGAEAKTMGLANFCVPDKDFDSEIKELVSSILSGSWFSHRANKLLLRDTDGMSLGGGLAHEVYRHPGKGPDALDRIATFKKR
jgi:enoyl-CoA hydratase/carnithine racemase